MKIRSLTTGVRYFAPPDDSGNKTPEEIAAEEAAAREADKSRESVTLTAQELQDRLDAVAAAARQQAERKAKNVLEEFKAELAQKKAEEDGKWQDLYTALKTDYDKLKSESASDKELLTASTDRQHRMIESEIADWPDEVKALDPGKDSSIDVRLAWKDKAKALATKVKSLSKAPEGESNAGKRKQEDSDKEKSAQELVQGHIAKEFPKPKF